MFIDLQILDFLKLFCSLGIDDSNDFLKYEHIFGMLVRFYRLINQKLYYFYVPKVFNVFYSLNDVYNRLFFKIKTSIQ